MCLHEIVEDPAGKISIQFPGDPTLKTYRVDGWLPSDPAPTSSRVSFYDRIALRPNVGAVAGVAVRQRHRRHPPHAHPPVPVPTAQCRRNQAGGGRNDVNFYDPETRSTSTPLVPDSDNPPRTYEPAEVHGWNDVIRVDPGNVVEVAVRFDLPGRFVYTATSSNTKTPR